MIRYKNRKRNFQGKIVWRKHPRLPRGLKGLSRRVKLFFPLFDSNRWREWNQKKLDLYRQGQHQGVNSGHPPAIDRDQWISEWKGQSKRVKLSEHSTIRGRNYTYHMKESKAKCYDGYISVNTVYAIPV